MARFSVTFFFLLSLLTYSLGAAADAPAAVPASAASSAAAPVLLTPEQARQALIVLDDPKQRSQVEDTLRAVAAAGVLAAPAPASSPAATATSASAASGVTAAFKANGLVTQLSHQLTRWAKSIARKTKHSTVALLDFSSIPAWWDARMSTPEQRAQLLDIGWIALASLVPALALQWLVAWPLLKLRRKIGVRANAAAAAALADAVLTPGQRAQAHDEQIAAALTGGGEAGVRQPLAKTLTATGKLHAVRHWSLFRRLPAALLNFMLAALPLIVFTVAAELLLSMLTEEGSVADNIVFALVDVYFSCLVTLLIVDLFVAPHAPGLRLRRISDAAAEMSWRWMRRIVIVAGIGTALSEALKPLGVSDDAVAIIMRLTVLVVLVMVAIVIIECRQRVGDWLRRSTASRKSLSSLGNLLAEIWVGAALILVFALWLMWALDILDGVETLLHLAGLSVAVLIVARVCAIIAFGALSHLFDANHGDNTPAVAAETSTAAPDEPVEPVDSVEPVEEPSIVRRRAYRYYPMARQFVTAALGVVTVLILLDIWGVHLLRFLTASQIGHRLMSALVTIAIAAAVAVLIWEAANISFERRLRSWTDRGEFVRASRLRTLMPMLRSALLVAIGLIVGLTGLSQIGVNIAPLLAGASIFGVALGFGSQKLVQDFITGIFLLMENAMQVGDWVTVAGVSGSVEYLSIRTVRLRGSDGSLFTVPFSSVTTVNNVNRGIGNASVRISIAYGADVERAIALLKSIGEELRTDPDFKDGILSDFSFWGVDALDGAAVTLAGQIQCRDSMRWPVQREFNRRILARFTAEGIDIANPLRNVMVPPSRAVSAPQAEAAPATSNPGGAANTAGLASAADPAVNTDAGPAAGPAAGPGPAAAPAIGPAAGPADSAKR